jgi:cytochrome c-type biogenesis protein CcmH
MCTCGCAQLLGECNHVGCPRAGGARRADDGHRRGQSDKEILDAFVAKYGATVLAAPTTKGFDLVAWIAPFAVFAAALLGTILLVRRWGGWAANAGRAGGGHGRAFRSGGPRAPGAIRRETGSDGGRF